MGAWPQDKKEGNLGERNGGNLGSKKPQDKQQRKCKWRTYRILFGSKAKAVRDGRAKWRGKREKYKNRGRPGSDQRGHPPSDAPKSRWYQTIPCMVSNCPQLVASNQRVPEMTRHTHYIFRTVIYPVLFQFSFVCSLYVSLVIHEMHPGDFFGDCFSFK